MSVPRHCCSAPAAGHAVRNPVPVELCATAPVVQIAAKNARAVSSAAGALGSSRHACPQPRHRRRRSICPRDPRCRMVYAGAWSGHGRQAGAARRGARDPPPAGAPAHRLRRHLPGLQPAGERGLHRGRDPPLHAAISRSRPTAAWRWSPASPARRSARSAAARRRRRPTASASTTRCRRASSAAGPAGTPYAAPDGRPFMLPYEADDRASFVAWSRSSAATFRRARCSMSSCAPARRRSPRSGERLPRRCAPTPRRTASTNRSTALGADNADRSTPRAPRTTGRSTRFRTARSDCDTHRDRRPARPAQPRARARSRRAGHAPLRRGQPLPSSPAPGAHATAPWSR